MNTLKGFDGLKVAAFESRRAVEMAELISRNGGDPLVTPSLREVPLEGNSAAFNFADRLLAGQIDMLIMLTGVGMQTLMSTLETKYERQVLVNALSSIRLVSRGPKPQAILKSFGLEPSLVVPEPSTWREVLKMLDEATSLGNLQIAVQEYGVTNEEFISGLRARGAEVLRVPVYRWALPEDTTPLKLALESVINGEVDVVIFTNAHQISNLMLVAKEHGLEKSFLKALRKAVVASIGPHTTSFLDEYGCPVDFEPVQPKMESFVEQISRESTKILQTKRGKDVIPAQAGIQEIMDPRFRGGDIGSWKEAVENSLFMKACRCQSVETTPIWLMRQAGRYLSSYRDLREKYSFLELCKNSDLAAELTVDAVKLLDVDVGIIFSDILLIVEPMGLLLEYTKSDGPVIHAPIRKSKDVARVADPDMNSLNFVYDAIRKARAWLPSHIPLIGFSAAPFTLASYIIEGDITRNFIHTKSFMYSDGVAWNELMDRISDALIFYLNAQIKAGAQALELFDSWVGCLSPEDYRKFVLPFTKRVIGGIDKEVPVIYFGTQTSELLELMKETGSTVIGLDWRVELDQAWQRLGEVAVQGNLDPAVLYADRATIRQKAERILRQAGGRAGHIFNLGHGVLPDTPLESARYLVDIVHQWKNSLLC